MSRAEVVLTAVALLTGCPSSSPDRAAPVPCTLASINANTCSCTLPDSSQCPTGYICDVDVTRICVFECTKAADCTGPSAPANVSQNCAASSQGCECRTDPAAQLTICFAPPCARDADCGSDQRCRNGACTATPDPSPTACRLYPASAVVRAGATVTFALYDEAPETRLANDSDATWSTGDAGLVLQDAGSFAVLGSIGPGLATVTAASGTATCTATVQVLPPLGSATALRVVVLDEVTGGLVEGAMVQIEGSTQPVTATSGVALFFGGGQVEIHLAAVWRSSAGELTTGVMGQRSWDATTKAGALAALPGVWRMVPT